MKHLSIHTDTWEFVTREKDRHHKTVIFRCGRDFIYYALHYYHPHTFNKTHGGSSAIEATVFGYTTPTWLLFTTWHLKQLPSLLIQHDLLFSINNRPVRSWWQLLRQLYRKTVITPENLEASVVKSISRGTVIGIDFSIKWFGLVDHVLFVYGYDEENYYVFDTLQLPQLPYEKLTNKGDAFYMKLPKQAVYERLRPISRIWTVEPLNIG